MIDISAKYPDIPNAVCGILCCFLQSAYLSQDSSPDLASGQLWGIAQSLNFSRLYFSQLKIRV